MARTRRQPNVSPDAMLTLLDFIRSQNLSLADDAIVVSSSRTTPGDVPEVSTCTAAFEQDLHASGGNRTRTSALAARRRA